LDNFFNEEKTVKKDRKGQNRVFRNRREREHCCKQETRVTSKLGLREQQKSTAVGWRTTANGQPKEKGRPTWFRCQARALGFTEGDSQKKTKEIKKKIVQAH